MGSTSFADRDLAAVAQREALRTPGIEQRELHQQDEARVRIHVRAGDVEETGAWDAGRAVQLDRDRHPGAREADVEVAAEEREVVGALRADPQRAAGAAEAFADVQDVAPGVAGSSRAV